MTDDRQKPELDAEMIVLCTGYATGLLVVVGWIATLVL